MRSQPDVGRRYSRGARREARPGDRRPGDGPGPAASTRARGGARRLGGHPRAGPRAPRAGRGRRDAPLGPRRRAAHRPPLGHGGGRRAGGAGLGAPRARPHRPPGHPPGAHRRRAAAGGPDRRRTSGGVAAGPRRAHAGPTSYAPRDPGRRRGGGPVTVRVGLTGGIASGKSTVSAVLADLGAVVIDADLIAREVVARGTPGLAAVVEEFGPDLLTPDGDLDRPAMGALVFADPDARRRLEAIIHPLVHRRSAELEAAAPEHAVLVHDIPLLAEVGRAGSFDAVVVVDAPAELQVRRMVEDRGWTREDAESRIAAQATREERLAIATHVVDNTGSLADLRRQVEAVDEELARRA